MTMQMTEQDYVQELIERLKPHLPMTVTPGKAMLAARDGNGKKRLKIKKDSKLVLTDAIYLGAEGGLSFSCAAPTPSDKQVMVISVTHLKLDPKHPFYKELRAYQLGRTTWLVQKERSADYVDL